MSTPEVTTGQHPDGTPWVVGVDFGSNVSIDAYGRLRASLKRPDTAEQARSVAASLLAAAEWMEQGRSAALEAELA